MHLHGLVLLLCALYGSVFVFGKLTLEYAPPVFITGGRMLLAGAILLLFQFIYHRELFRSVQKRHFFLILIVAFSGVYLTNIMEFWGLQFMEAGKACFIYSFSPIATAIISYFWLSEKINLQKLIGLSIGILGFIPMLVTSAPTEAQVGSIFFLSYAELAILGAAVTSSMGWIAMRSLVKHNDLSLVIANGLTMFIGGIISFIHSFLTENWNPTPITDLGPFLKWFLILMLVSNIISYNLNSFLLKSFTATYLSFAGLTQPFFAALFGWLLIGEVESMYFWISVIFVMIGLYIYYQQDLKHGLVTHKNHKSTIPEKL